MLSALVTLLCIALPIGAFAGGEAVGAIQLTEENHLEYIGKDKPVLVAFTAPWCGHCKTLIPEYEDVVRAMRQFDVVIAQVSSDKSPLMSKYKVSGFPTVKLFTPNSPADFPGIEYEGARKALPIVKFLNKKFGFNGVIKVPAPAVEILTEENFDSIVHDPTKNVLVKFFAPWCGHCKAMAADYENTARSFEGVDSVVIAELDGDKYPAIAGQYGIQGFPTLKFFRAGATTGKKHAEDYQGGRSPAELVAYMNEAAGTDRTVGGGVSARAGRDYALDALAQELAFKLLNGDKRGAQGTLPVIEKTVAGLIAEQPHLKYYALYGKAIINKGSEFPVTELSRLQRMAESGNVGTKARAELMMRANIAKAFLISAPEKDEL
jgi:protein disulfide-isomerase A6